MSCRYSHAKRSAAFDQSPGASGFQRYLTARRATVAAATVPRPKLWQACGRLGQPPLPSRAERFGRKGTLVFGHGVPLRAFTLVEMLVVVAVLAVLAALAMPIAGRFTSSGHAAKSVSNLRQIAVLANSYAADNNGYYPRDPRGRYYPSHLMLAYDGFLKDADGKVIDEAEPAANSIFRSPGETRPTDKDGLPWYQSHYTFNFYLITTAQEMAGLNGTNPCRRPLSAIDNPSKLFLVADTATRYPIGAEDRKHAFRNGPEKRWYVAFVDGHVESVAER